MTQERSQYRAESPIDHNKKRYEIGAPIALTAEEAEPLLAIGRISPIEAAPEQKTAVAGDKKSAPKAGKAQAETTTKATQ